MRKTLFVFILLLGTVFPPPSLAAAPAMQPPGHPPPVSGNVASGLNESYFAVIFNKLISPSATYGTASAIAAKLRSGMALKMLGILAGLSIIIGSLKWMLSDSPQEVMGELIGAMLTIGLFTFFMFRYPGFSGAIQSLFMDLNSAIGAPDAAITAGKLAGAGGHFIGEAFAEVGRAGFSLLHLDASSWLFFILTAGLLLITGTLLIFTGLAYIIMLVVGDVLAAVAIALGPFFVALGVWESSRDYFYRWMAFFTTALGIKVIASVLVVLLTGMVNDVTVDISTTVNDTAAFSSAFGAMLFAVALDYIILQTLMIASNLFGASISGSGDLVGHGAGRMGRLAKMGGSVRGMSTAIRRFLIKAIR